MSPPAVELFAGPGGVSLALRDLGLEAIGIESDEAVCATRDAAGLRTLRGDVAAIDPWSLGPWSRGVGLVASPPCPPFSRAGKRLGALDFAQVWDVTRDLALGYGRRERVRLLHDDRSLLVTEPWRWTLALRPRWIMLEQVEDVLPYWRFLCEGLEALGYSTWAGVLSAERYGVPQTRRRAILLASSDRQVGEPIPTHRAYVAPRLRKADHRLDEIHLEPYVTMADALGWDDGPKRPARTICGHRAPRWAYDRPAMALTTTPRCEEGLPVYGSWRYRNGNRENSAERTPNEPAPTLCFDNNANKVEWTRERPATTVQGTPRIGRPGHKDREDGESQFAADAVPVTLEEAAILQGFPAGYPFRGNKTQRSQQIGNAVPPPLARACLLELVGEREEAAAA